MELSERMNRTNGANGANGTDMETLLMVGGVAMIVFGAGLVLSSPVARRYLGQVGIGSIASAAMPDIERYLRLRSM